MKKVSFVAIIALCVTQLFAQTIVRGTIFEANRQPLEFATVALYSAADSILLQGDITKATGQYTLENVRTGKYYITVSMIGFTTAQLPVDVAVTQQVHAMPDITLVENTQSLQEVTVTARRQFVEQQADKMVINPEASITTASEDALEVLRKSPGIIVDKDDNITLKNKGVRVMIDGRPTYMSGTELAAMLRTMQATSVDRIEIIENPSARFDAEGDGGIINIRTKRGMMRGYNGSLTLGAAQSSRFSDNYGLDLNYRTGKVNVYGNYYGGQRRGWSDVDLIRRFPLSDGSTNKQYSYETFFSTYSNAKFGMDYYLTPKQIIGFMARGNFGRSNFNSNSDARITDAADHEIQRLLTDNLGDNKYYNLLFNLNYKYTIDSLGQELSIDADMANYYSQNLSDMHTTYVPPQPPQIFHKDQRGTSDFYSIKADYILPISPKGKMEMGLKSSRAAIDSDLDYKQQDAGGAWFDPGNMSNRFVYSENIHAAYVSAHYAFSEKTSVQLGLRGEQTIAEGHNITSDERNKRNYFNLFPSFFLQQKLNADHQLGVSYSHRIGRPPYGLLNPFVYMLDPTTYNRGNPFLDAQFTHASKLSYTLKSKYILSLGYSYTKNSWMQVFNQDDATRTTIIDWANLNDYYNTDVTLVLPVDIARWWKTNTNLTGYYGQYKSPFQGGVIDKSQFTFAGYSTFTFMLPKDIAIEMSGRYMSKSVYGMAVFNARGSVDIGAQKQLFDKKATLKLSVSDVFQTQQSSYLALYENVNLYGKQRFDSRRVNLTFTWRFGRTDIKAARQRGTGLDEETSRAGN